jgi:hypothetical protein
VSSYLNIFGSILPKSDALDGRSRAPLLAKNARNGAPRDDDLRVAAAEFGKPHSEDQSAVTVTVLLGKLQIDAETVVDVPVKPTTVPVATVAVVLVAVIELITVVSRIFHVTEPLTFCWAETPLKVANAIKLASCPDVTVALVLPFTVIARASTTGHTFTVWVELVTVPMAALTVVVPGRVPCNSNCERLTAVRLPGVGKVATPVSDESQTDLPVASLVLPSL